jgi:hypothetical protein
MTPVTVFDSNSVGTEICYNIRHFELHGRDLADPWSCRHAVFYQQYMLAEHSSTWIIIQGPTMLKPYIEKAISEQKRLMPELTEHPLHLHVHILKTMELNWEAYLITLGEQCRKTVCFFFFLVLSALPVRQRVHSQPNLL